MKDGAPRSGPSRSSHFSQSETMVLRYVQIYFLPSPALVACLTPRQFLLQADFLLIASREDINGSSMWNRALRNAAVDALIEAAQAFNRGSMKYTWLRYFPLKGE